MNEQEWAEEEEEFTDGRGKFGEKYCGCGNELVSEEELRDNICKECI